MGLRRLMRWHYRQSYDAAAAGLLPNPGVYENDNEFTRMARAAGHADGRREFERLKRALRDDK